MVETEVKIIWDDKPVVVDKIVAIPEQWGAGVVRIEWRIPNNVGGPQKYDNSWIMPQLKRPIATKISSPNIIGFLQALYIIGK